MKIAQATYIINPLSPIRMELHFVVTNFDKLILFFVLYKEGNNKNTHNEYDNCTFPLTHDDD